MKLQSATNKYIMYFIAKHNRTWCKRTQLLGYGMHLSVERTQAEGVVPVQLPETDVIWNPYPGTIFWRRSTGITTVDVPASL